MLVYTKDFLSLWMGISLGKPKIPHTDTAKSDCWFWGLTPTIQH